MTGAVVTDVLPEGLKYKSFTVKDSDGSVYSDGNLNVNGNSVQYTFGSAEKKEYDITIISEVDQTKLHTGVNTFKNTATVTPKGESGTESNPSSVTYTVNPGTGKNTKILVSSGVPDAKSVYTAQWESTMDISSFHMNTMENFDFTDWLPQIWDSYNNNQPLSQTFSEDSITVKSNGNVLTKGKDYTVELKKIDSNSTNYDKLYINFLTLDKLSASVTIDYSSTVDCSVFSNVTDAVKREIKNTSHFAYKFKNIDAMNSGDKSASWNYEKAAAAFKKTIDSLTWDSKNNCFSGSCSIIANGTDKYSKGTEDLKDKKLVITDTMGEGMSYVANSAKVYMISPNNYLQTYNGKQIEPEKAGQTLTWDFGKNPTNDTDGHIKIYITYDVTVSSGVFKNEPYEYAASNAAKLTADGKDIASGSDIKKISLTPLTKTADHEQSSQYIKYTIDVNKEKYDYNSAGETIELKDTIPETCTLDTSSIKIYQYNTADETWKELSGKYVRYDSTTASLIFTVPDKEYLRIEYQVQLNGTVNEWVTVSNKVEMQGKTDVSSTASGKYQVCSSSGGITGSEGSISLNKTDPELNPLQSAVFDLYRITMTQKADETWGKSESKIDTQTTDAKGILTFQKDTEAGANSALQYDTLYCYEENSAPQGYKKDTEKHYFIIKSQNGAYETVMAQAEKCNIKDINTVSDTETILVTNKKMGELTLKKFFAG